MNRCPICYARFKPDMTCANCFRCGSDLNLLTLIEKNARNLLHIALANFVNGDKQQALKLLQQSFELKNDELVLVLQNFITSYGDRARDLEKDQQEFVIADSI